MNKQIVFDHPEGGWISLAEVAAIARVDCSTFRQQTFEYIKPHQRAFSGGNSQVCWSVTFEEAREFLDMRRAGGHFIPVQDWEFA